MNPRVLIQSDEAEWTGLHKVWASVQQFAPARRKVSSWWLVLIGVACVALALGASL